MMSTRSPAPPRGRASRVPGSRDAGRPPAPPPGAGQPGAGVRVRDGGRDHRGASAAAAAGPVGRAAGRAACPGRDPAAAGAGCGAGRATGAGPTPAGVGSVLAPLLSAATLGSHVGMLVTSLATGQVLYSSNAAGGFAPASTTKIATAVAALSVLGPAAQFRTRVVAGAVARAASSWSAGATRRWPPGTPPAADYPQPATLAALAAQTARALRARGTSQRDASGYDTSLYAGPGLAPGWPDSYVTTGNVTPDQLAGGRPGPADARRRPAGRRRPAERARPDVRARAGGGRRPSPASCALTASACTGTPAAATAPRPRRGAGVGVLAAAGADRRARCCSRATT